MVAKNTDHSDVPRSGNGQKKGRPTPTRKEAQARHLRPLVPTDRKAAKRAAREKRSQEFQREQEALLTGDERHMPYAHRGKIRRFIRDTVDTRWSFSEFIVPSMLLFMVALTVVVFVQPKDPTVVQYVWMGVTILFYGIFILSLFEAFFLWRRIKREIPVRFPNEVDNRRGGWFYMYSRMVMARRWRSPRPQIARSEKI